MAATVSAMSFRESTVIALPRVIPTGVSLCGGDGVWRARNPRSCVPGSAGRADRSAGRELLDQCAPSPDWRKPLPAATVSPAAQGLEVQPGGCSQPDRVAQEEVGRSARRKSARAASGASIARQSPARIDSIIASSTCRRPILRLSGSDVDRARRIELAQRRQQRGFEMLLRRLRRVRQSPSTGTLVAGRCFEIDDLFAERTDCLQDAVLALLVAPAENRGSGNCRGSTSSSATTSRCQSLASRLRD